MTKALSVLMVEDDAMIGLLLAEILQEIGYTVCGIVATEERAVVDAARLQPGLMLVDVNLHEGSGVSAVQRILKSGSRPCVFMSGGAGVAPPPRRCCASHLPNGSWFWPSQAWLIAT